MSDHVCLPKTHMIIVFSIFIGLSVWYIHNDKKSHVNESNYKFSDSVLNSLNQNLLELKNKIDKTENSDLANKNDLVNKNDLANKNNIANKKYQTVLNEEIERRNFIQERDQKVAFNDFTAPERRQPEHAYPIKQVKSIINIPSRGLPDNYQIVGLLLRNNTESAFKLFGRQKYPGSNQWEYYAQGVMSHNDVKIPITIRGDREIEDGQTVVIPGTNHTKGGFKVKLYNYDLPRYNPFDY